MLDSGSVSLYSHLFAYTAGAASTVAGSWVASKIHFYHDARNAHRDDLRKQVLKPLSHLLSEGFCEPRPEVDWYAESYTPSSTIQESTRTGSPRVLVKDAASTAYSALNGALVEDAQKNHYCDVMSSFEKFRVLWSEHNAKCRALIDHLAHEIPNRSTLPAYPSTSQRYVATVQLALFAYMRLMEKGTSSLTPQPSTFSGLTVLTDGGTQYAQGTSDEISSLIGIIESIIKDKRHHALELRSHFSKLIEERDSVSRQLSFALASKKLSHRCPLVTFF